jgi:hypothetical protein
MNEDLTLNNNPEQAETTPENNQEQVAPLLSEHLDPAKELAALKEANFRQVREEAERERKRAYQAEQQLEEYRRQLQSRHAEPDDLDSDDIADKRHLKKIRDEARKQNEELAKKSQLIEEQIQKIEYQSVLNEVTALYPDFRSTVTEDALARLNAKEPELFETVLNNKNARSRLIAAYKTVKAHVNTKSYDALDAKIAENKTKPRSAATVPIQESASPLGSFREQGSRWKLSAEEAKALREDTRRCAKNRI